MADFLQKPCRLADFGALFIKYWKEKKNKNPVNVEFYTHWKYLSKTKLNCFEHKRLNSSPEDLNYRNIKGNPLGRKKMMIDRDMDLFRGIKTMGNGNGIIT